MPKGEDRPDQARLLVVLDALAVSLQEVQNLLHLLAELLLLCLRAASGLSGLNDRLQLGNTPLRLIQALDSLKLQSDELESESFGEFRSRISRHRRMLCESQRCGGERTGSVFEYQGCEKPGLLVPGQG